MDFHLNTPSQFVAKICAALDNLPNQVGISVKSKVIVAISGGPDSTALLLALHLVSEHNGLELGACHINHKLRGAQSDEDEQFCRQLCASLSISLDVYESDVVDLEPSESILRATRYDFLFRCAEAANTKFVFLAHQSGDQVETVLFRIFRGTSNTGLTGMKSAHQMRNGIWLLRPMLSCSRDEVDEFLKLSKVSARLDASNLSNKYARNFLRNQVMPLCKSRFPSIDRQVERLRELAVDDEEFLAAATSRFIEQLGGADNNSWSTKDFDVIHVALQRRVIAKALECRNIEVSFERVQAVLNMMANPSQAKRTTLNHDWDISVNEKEISWVDMTTSTAPTSQWAPVVLNVPGRAMLLSLGWVLNVAVWTGPVPATYPDRSEMTAAVDLSDISPPLVFRKINDVDQIQPLGMSQTVSLKRYLKSNKNLLSNWSGFVLADQREVLWLPGVGLSEKIKVRVEPTHQLSILAISADFATA